MAASTAWTRDVPRVGQKAERSRTVEPGDIELFTRISGDRNPLHYDAGGREGLALRRDRGAGRDHERDPERRRGRGPAGARHGLPAGGLEVHRTRPPGDTITGAVEVVEVREDKPITKLKTSVRRQDGVVVLEGTAVCYTMALVAG
jgi:acyl dehydratase